MGINHRTVTAVICTVRVWDKATDNVPTGAGDVRCN